MKLRDETEVLETVGKLTLKTFNAKLELEKEKWLN